MPFEHRIGQPTVDLTSPGLPLDGQRVEARLGIGDLVVLVPADVDVTLDACVSAGNVEALGETENGFDVDPSASRAPPGRRARPRPEVGLGNLRVELER